MKLLFLLAGVPSILKKVIDRSDRDKIEEDDDLRIFAAGPGQVYSPLVREELLKEAVAWVGQWGPDDCFGIALLHVNSNDGSSNALLQDFFPFAFQTMLEIGPLPDRANALRAVKNRFVYDVKRVCVTIRQRAKLLYDHLDSAAKATPLLLPLVNFPEPALRDRLFKLYCAGGDGDSMTKNIAWTRKHLRRELPRRIFEGREYFFSNELFFIPPGDQGHAVAAWSDECPRRCFLAGRARLGASFNARLHYDCRPERGTVSASYPSCHGQMAEPSKAAYVNIAPNDYIR